MAGSDVYCGCCSRKVVTLSEVGLISGTDVYCEACAGEMEAKAEVCQ